MIAMSYSHDACQFKIIILQVKEIADSTLSFSLAWNGSVNYISCLTQYTNTNVAQKKY